MPHVWAKSQHSQPFHRPIFQLSQNQQFSQCFTWNLGFNPGSTLPAIASLHKRSQVLPGLELPHLLGCRLHKPFNFGLSQTRTSRIAIPGDVQRWLKTIPWITGFAVLCNIWKSLQRRVGNSSDCKEHRPFVKTNLFNFNSRLKSVHLPEWTLFVLSSPDVERSRSEKICPPGVQTTLTTTTKGKDNEIIARKASHITT